MNPDLPNVDATHFEQTDLERLVPAQRSTHAPRILLLYGSARERSYSRLLTEEAARLLRALGAETRIFDPRGLPQVNRAMLLGLTFHLTEPICLRAVADKEP